MALAEDKSFPFRLVARVELEDHTLCMWVLHQFRDVEGGLEMQLRTWWPQASPISPAEMTKHLAIEFRNSIRLAAAQAVS